MPSALHLFNKDLLCSKTLIQGAHTHSRARTNTHLAFFSSQAANGKKKVRDVGLETLGALFVNSHSDERREEPAGTQR